MLIKFLLIAILLYFIGKTVMNLASAVLYGAEGRPQMPRPDTRYEPSPQQDTAYGGDVEDARWVDL